MSQLDRYFTATARRGLVVYPQLVGGESTLEHGYLYLVEGADVPAYFGIARHTLADARNKRVALKIVAAAPTPPGGPIRISAPDGQQIEGDDGWLATGMVDAGVQALGTYREWLCDADGNWLLVRNITAGATVDPAQVVIAGIGLEIQGVPVVITGAPALYELAIGVDALEIDGQHLAITP